jgi:DNA modification methylase
VYFFNLSRTFAPVAQDFLRRKNESSPSSPVGFVFFVYLPSQLISVMNENTTKRVKVSEIKPNPSNPRLIKDEKFKSLVKSIQDFPEMLDLRPIVVNADMIILGGNMRFKACKEAGLKEVPVTIAKGLTPEQEREFIIKDNVSGGDWDWEMLAQEWNADELEEWGLDLPEVMEAESTAEEDDYEMPDEIQTDIVLGDLFEIGEHRLLCGDSTDTDAVANLMNGERADMAFTSPPYNAGKSEALSGNTHTTDNKYNEYNDNQKQSDYLDLLIGFTNNALMNAEYLICNIQSLAGNKIALIDYLYQYKNNFIDVAIWDKGHGQPAMAENVMTSAWEYLFFISSKDKASRAIPNANFRGTVPNIYKGKPNRNNEFSHLHAATFPIDLPEWGLQFTRLGSIVLDQFLGTGTTMVASHQLKRKCYGMELDPKYCQVIIDRMRKLDPSIKIKRNGIEI